MHRHHGVEILSYVCTGRLTHADTMGNRANLDAGDVQVMRCGTGLRHSEVNGGQSPVRMYQLWLTARKPMVAPGYVDLAAPLNRVGDPPVVLASGKEGETGRVAIDVNALILGGALEAGGEIKRDVEAGRGLYVVAVEGSVSLDIHDLDEGDAGLCREPGTLVITARSAARVLVLDVAL